jgi:hypothetical protein
MKPHPDADAVLLLRTLENMGVEIRRGSFDTPGGLVKMEGRYILFLRAGIPSTLEKEVYLDAVKKMGPSAVHLPPRVRALMGEDDWGNDKGESNG